MKNSYLALFCLNKMSRSFFVPLYQVYEGINIVPFLFLLCHKYVELCRLNNPACVCCFYVAFVKVTRCTLDI